MNCYYKELVALSGKHCGTCESKTTSSIWYNDKERAGKYLCAKCYARQWKKIKERRKIEAEEAKKIQQQEQEQEQHEREHEHEREQKQPRKKRVRE